MSGFEFKTANGRWLALWALVILAFPAALWLIGYLGDCVASSSSAYCNNIPDFFASLLFAFYVFQVFGGWIVSAMLVILAIAMLGLAIAVEVAARRDSNR
ncbi:hypothetical protein HKCCE3408_08200 [Rhodobacterales bacterium HKCCE3408]|nr:hypothetical protein [Rhodobacterales bacterium HKCCE3408]